MSGDSVASVLRMMKVVGVLGLPADAQAQCLARMGVAPLVDELGLELHDHVLRVDEFVHEGYLSDTDADALRRLDATLAAMSGARDASLWTIEALEKRSEWDEVRRQARLVLCSL